MSEKIPFDNPELAEAADRLGYEALAEVTSRYGDGSPEPHFEPDIAALAYHNMLHTRDGRDHYNRIARRINLPPTPRALGLVAISYHDIVHDKPRGVMERESADMMVARMEEEGFASEHIQIAELGLLGTEPVMTEDGYYLGQRASLQDYPSHEAAIVAASVACADMGNLYSAYSPLDSHHLYQEHAGATLYEEPPMQGLHDFQDRLIRLLDEYRYPHSVGEVLFTGMRHEVMEHQLSITQDLQWGEIQRWPQVIQRDEAFVERYRTLE